MALQLHQFPCLDDNYGFLIHDPSSGATATVDTPEVAPIEAALEEKGWQLTHILNTHHHFDHAGGNEALKQRWNCTIVAAASDAHRIPGIDVKVVDGDTYEFGNSQARVFEGQCSVRWRYDVCSWLWSFVRGQPRTDVG